MKNCFDFSIYEFKLDEKDKLTFFELENNEETFDNMLEKYLKIREKEKKFKNKFESKSLTLMDSFELFTYWYS